MKVKILIFSSIIFGLYINLYSQEVESQSKEINGFRQELKGDDSQENNEPFSRLIVGLSGSMNSTKLINSTASNLSQWSTISNFSFIPSVDILYMYSRSLGFGMGLKLGNYSTGYGISDYSVTLEKEFVDIDNDKYFPIYENVQVDEVNRFSTLDIPIFANYTFGTGKIKYYAKLGVMLSVYTKTSFTLDGTLTRKGSYPQYNTILNNYPEYNFDNLSYSTADVFEIGNPSIGFSGIGSAGVLIDFAKTISMKIGLSGNYGFTDARPTIAKDFSNFHSSTILDKTILSSFGLEIGINYKIMNK